MDSSMGSPSGSSTSSSPAPHDSFYDDLLDFDFILGNTYADAMNGTLKVKQEPSSLPDFSSTFLDIPDIKFDGGLCDFDIDMRWGIY